MVTTANSHKSLQTHFTASYVCYCLHLLQYVHLLQMREKLSKFELLVESGNHDKSRYETVSFSFVFLSSLNKASL